MTFGEGVRDNETYPYLVGLNTKGRYAIRNLAFSGYGPHQMLASLQSDHFSQKLDCSPTHFFYFAIPAHIARVAGLTTWDNHGPRFTLGANGEPIRAGNFDDRASFEPRWIQAAFDKFFIWQRFFGRSRAPSQADLKLFVAVVHESARLAMQLYPHSEFHVFVEACSDEPDHKKDPDCEMLLSMRKELQSAGMLVHPLNQAIPDIVAHDERYRLSVYDRHPNALLHRLLANFIVQQVLTHPPR
jgi:hypothetical protein